MYARLSDGKKIFFFSETETHVCVAETHSCRSRLLKIYTNRVKFRLACICTHTRTWNRELWSLGSSRFYHDGALSRGLCRATRTRILGARNVRNNIGAARIINASVGAVRYRARSLLAFLVKFVIVFRSRKFDNARKLPRDASHAPVPRACERRYTGYCPAE